MIAGLRRLGDLRVQEIEEAELMLGRASERGRGNLGESASHLETSAAGRLLVDTASARTGDGRRGAEGLAREAPEAAIVDIARESDVPNGVLARTHRTIRFENLVIPQAAENLQDLLVHLQPIPFSRKPIRTPILKGAERLGCDG
jgi:hypothetical protein